MLRLRFRLVSVRGKLLSRQNRALGIVRQFVEAHRFVSVISLSSILRVVLIDTRGGFVLEGRQCALVFLFAFVESFGND